MGIEQARDLDGGNGVLGFFPRKKTNGSEHPAIKGLQNLITLINKRYSRL
jgi:hypothetical protein